MRVLVTICTRGRPRLLRSCLDSVCAQIPYPGADMDILVVENNERLTADSIVESQRQTSGRTIHLVLEPELGIPFARNRCGIFAAESGYDWLLYIDDDEVARPDWFRTMIDACREFDADVCYGRVIPVYPAGTPDWMIEPDTDKRKKGALLRKAEGHNTLVNTHIFAASEMALRFDGAMRFTGGSDTDFFSRIARAGGKIIWVGDAMVDELIPENRMTLRWQLHRTFRVAINISVLHEKQDGRRAAFLRSMMKGIGRLFDGIVRLPGALLIPLAPNLGKRLTFKAAKQIASGLGSFAYLFNIRPQPYRQVDGG